jgi:hypothetical protein
MTNYAFNRLRSRAMTSTDVRTLYPAYFLWSGTGALVVSLREGSVSLFGDIVNSFSVIPSLHVCHYDTAIRFNPDIEPYYSCALYSLKLGNASWKGHEYGYKCVGTWHRMSCARECGGNRSGSRGAGGDKGWRGSKRMTLQKEQSHGGEDTAPQYILPLLLGSPDGESLLSLVNFSIS